MARIIGLTGGIASGKTTACAYFRDQGIPIVDADVIAHEITAPNAEGTLTVAKAFGEDFIDERGAMNRAKMRALVFSNPETKEKQPSYILSFKPRQKPKLKKQPKRTLL